MPRLRVSYLRRTSLGPQGTFSGSGATQREGLAYHTDDGLTLADRNLESKNKTPALHRNA